MKQLIEIEAKYLKINDLLFDFKDRRLCKAVYVGFENPLNDGCTLSIKSVGVVF